MFLDNLKSNEVIDNINKLLKQTQSNILSKKDKEFNKWFILDKDNIKLNYDSLLIIDKNVSQLYEDTDETIVGNPLATLLSFEDINKITSNIGRLSIKIPYKLEMVYTSKIDENKEYVIYFIESKSKLFKSNIAEQNVDNSYLAVKELFDSKFNLSRQLDYKDIPFVVSDILSNNSIKGFQMLIYELIVMGLSRNLKDTSKEFRFEATPDSKYNDFQMINIRDISRNNSAFTALASENISKSILIALRQAKNPDKDNDNIAPQEQIALKKFN